MQMLNLNVDKGMNNGYKMDAIRKMLFYDYLTKNTNRVTIGQNSKKETNNMLEEILKKFAVLDMIIEKYTKTYKTTTLCQKGCFSCCNDYFYVSLIEYLAIRDYLVANNSLNLAIKSAKKQYKQFAKQNSQEYKMLETENVGFDFFFENENEIIKSQCPLLNSEGECSIYPNRPIICRTYGCSIERTNCKKIKQKSKKLFTNKISVKKLKKYLFPLDLAKMPMFIDNIDKYEYNDNLYIARAFPIVFWLNHDDEIIDFYNLSKDNKKENFVKELVKSRFVKKYNK